MIHYGGYFFSAIGAVIGVSLLSHFVLPEQYGRVALYIAIATLFQYIVRESLGASILRYSEQIVANKQVAMMLIKQSIPKLLLIWVLVVIPAFFYFNQASFSEYAMGALLFFLLGVSAVGEALLSALQQRTACAVHVNLVQWLRFLLAALFYVVMDQSVLAILAGFCVGFLITILFDSWIYYHRTATPSISNHTVNIDNIFAGYSALVIGFLMWFMMFYERIALEGFYGETYLGAYFVLYQIGFVPVVMVMRSAVTFIFPKLFVNNAIDFAHLNRKNMLLVIASIAVAFLMLELLHHWLFSWLVGPHYRQYSWLLPWLFLAAVLNACSYMLQAFYYDATALKKLLVIKAWAALACFVLMTTFIWQFAVQGLIAASVVVSLLLIVMSYRAINKP